MKPTRKTSVYQRVCLGGTWYVIIPEDELRQLTQQDRAGKTVDALDALSMSNQRLADRLLRRRQDAGLTQKALARLAGVRVETLNRIERGHTTPDFRTVRKLVNAMNEYRSK